MILQRLLAHLQETPAATLAELARVVDAPPDAVRSMLDTLERKGLVHRRVTAVGCGSSCQQCDQGKIEVFCPGAGPEDLKTLPGCGLVIEKTNSPGD